MTKFEAKICVFLKVDFAFVGVVLHDTMKKTILGLSQEKRFMAGKSYRRGGKGHGKKNIRWNFIYMYWIFLMIASIKMIFVDDPKAKKLLSEAVYVTTDTVDPANDGKAVIVSAPFKLVEPAYDDEMGLTLDSIRISRKKERTEYERKQNDEDDRKEKLVWNQEGASEEYIGEGMVGGYTLSEDFIHMIRMTGTWKDYDEQVLKELGYAFVSDPSYSQGYFIEPLDQTERSYQYYLENDIRYSYSYADFKDGDKVTAIGIQDGQTLKKAPGMTEYLMKGEMDMETAIKEGGAAGIGLKIFSIAISLIFMLGGVLMFVIKR